MTPQAIQRTFTGALETLRYGTLADELDKSLRELVLECTSCGKAGELVLKLKVKPSKGNGPLEITDDLTLKLPKPEKGSSLMWPTVEGHLQRTDPRQDELPGLGMVDKSTGEIKAIAKG